VAGLPRLSVGVRWSPPTNVAIVTQIVTRAAQWLLKSAARSASRRLDGPWRFAAGDCCLICKTTTVMPRALCAIPRISHDCIASDPGSWHGMISSCSRR
jgi:hypothetical protein